MVMASFVVAAVLLGLLVLGGAALLYKL